MFSLTLSFFIISVLYSIVGFGGGTSYIAILAASNISYTMIPKISLLCNLIVVSGGIYHAHKQGHFNKRLILPFILSSAPMAFLGGSLPIKEKTFFIILTISLMICGIRLLFLRDRAVEKITPPSIRISLMIGGLLGLLSGMVGIGGGIFLSPLLINFGFSRSKEAAATSSVFIFVNSFFALIGQLTKDSEFLYLGNYTPLLLVVLIGGQIGSRLGMGSKVSFNHIQKGTGVLTLFICIRLLMKSLMGV